MFGLGLGRLGSVGQRTLAQQVAALFPDVWYDPSDLTTLYQDAAGTTPVTAVEQPVGLMLDKSRGLVLGSELVVNGDFSNGTTGWTASVTGSNAITISGGSVRFQTTGADTATLSQGSVYAVNKFYRVEFDVVSGNGAKLKLGSLTSNSEIEFFCTPGRKTFTAYATNATFSLNRVVGQAADAYIDNISVRELPGNHAFHTPGDTTTRPVLSRRINFAEKTENVSDTYWNKTKVTTPSADTLQDDNTAGFHYFDKRTFSFTAGTQYIAQVRLEKGTIGYAGIHIVESSTARGCSIDLTTGQLGTPYGGATASAVADGAGWVLTIGATSVATAPGTGELAVYMSTSNSLASYTGTGSGTIKASKISLVPADLAALPYQRVNTATDYDANPALFPAYLRCDGTNDGMQTNAIDFSGTDKMFVGAAVRKLSDAAAGTVLELSANSGSNSGAFAVFAPSGAVPSYGLRSRGTSSALAEKTASLYAAPISNVVAGNGDIGADGCVLCLNGSVASTDNTDQGTGNYGNYPLYLFRRGGSSLPFNGWFYGSVIKGATLTAAQIALVERYLATKTKAVVLA